VYPRLLWRPILPQDASRIRPARNFVSYFVTLILAIVLSPVPHDWYSTTISRLAFHPKGHGAHDSDAIA
jgi:hypothetical protein